MLTSRPVKRNGKRRTRRRGLGVFNVGKVGAASFLWLAGVFGCSAEFGNRYRQALHEALTNSPTDRSCGTVYATLIPDCPVEGVCFTEACDAHDQCYATCGSSRDACDYVFGTQMVSVCLDALPLGSPESRGCLYAASVYWGAVRRLGARAFQRTQTDHGCDEPEVPPDDTPRIAGCCRNGPPPVCVDVAEADCPVDAVFYDGLTCPEVETLFGGCVGPPNDACESRRRVCENAVPDPDLGRCAEGNVLGVAGAICSLSGQDCFADGPCLPWRIGEVFGCRVEADTRLASTDGPEAGGACEPSGAASFQADVWFEYVAPCSGTMHVSMCESAFYDSMLAVHGSNDPAMGCECPAGNETLLACDDDGCFTFSSPSALELPGVLAGACYLIRVGGWSSDGTPAAAERGTSTLEIGLFCDPTPEPSVR
jgi:hypothetical protein